MGVTPLLLQQLLHILRHLSRQPPTIRQMLFALPCIRRREGLTAGHLVASFEELDQLGGIPPLPVQAQSHDAAGDGAAETLAATDAAAEGLGHLDNRRVNIVMMGEEDRFAAVASKGEVMPSELAGWLSLLKFFLLKEAAQVKMHI